MYYAFVFLHQQKIGFLELNGKKAQHNDLKIGLNMTETTPKQARGLAKRTEEGARHISVETCDALRSLADQLEAVTEKRDFAVESAKGTADLCAQAIADLTAVTTERDALAVKLDHIAKTIDKQLRVIDERARGDFLDKRPVVQSLMMHARTARAAIAKEAK